ncbi:hypothetical protein Pint_06534 [Pistacia integerrima]|uniref:Uncharacterized protein n=1 Tax=Pistacia integerrima TaxID=434235 RepID=A0ACC0Z589_9ROSI|nr:hypothetical protein Pint_06534 [Pistacia integerrima]
MYLRKEDLDLVLVPAGLLMMLTYHFFLLYRYLNLPQTTALGFENHNRRAWVGRIVLNRNKDTTGAAVSVISSHTTAATFLSTISILLSSLIGAWLGSSSNNVFQSNFILGDTKIHKPSRLFSSGLFMFCHINKLFCACKLSD